MHRHAFAMKLKPGCEEEYQRKHDEIWRELVEQMRERGTTNYSIFRHGLLLFAYQENANREQGSASPTPLTRSWWREMAPLMETNEDGSPWREGLEEVFHLD